MAPALGLVQCLGGKCFRSHTLKVGKKHRMQKGFQVVGVA
jgi:hypothetical protein